jgi:RNA polymerase sigma factor (sigma-70 family)
MIHIDNRFIIGLRNNDSASISEIYERFSGKINKMVSDNNGDENDAADIFQESLLYIYNRAQLKEFVLTCPFEAYLYMVGKNKWLNELQKRKNKRVTFIEEDGFNKNTPLDDGVAQMLTKETKHELIEKAVVDIGAGCATLLKYSWQGLAMEEVGQKLNMTYAYVRKKKSECMGKLIELIKKEPNYKLLIS